MENGKNRELLTLNSGDMAMPYEWSIGLYGSRFFQEIREKRRFLGIRCPKCQKVLVPPRRICGPCFQKLDELVELVSCPVGLIKIDVEGAEYAVLEGATRVLAECRPLFYVEVGAEQNADVTAVFQRLKYRLYDGDSDDEVELTQCAFNTLAVPRESTRTNRC